MDPDFTFADKIVETIVELLFHLVEVFDGEAKHVCLAHSFDSELPMERASVLKPIIQSAFLNFNASNDVHDSEVVAVLYFDIFHVLVFWHHK